MRVRGARSLRWRDEDGAAAIIVVISLMALFGVAALAIDVGSLWWTRRSLVVDVDASALAAASAAAAQVAASGCGASATADAATAATEILTANDPATAFDPSDPTNFTLDCDGVGGRATVTVTKNRGHVFANVFGGSGSTDVRTQGAAEFGPIVAAERVRPLPLCVGGPGMPSAYDSWRTYVTTGTVDPLDPLYVDVTTGGIPYFKVEVDDTVFQTVCNPLGLAASGGFRWIDFDGKDGGANGEPCLPEDAEGVPGGGSAELKARMQTGYACYVHTHAYRADGETGHDDPNSGHNCRPDDAGWERDSCPSGDGVAAADLNCIEGSAGCSVNQVCPASTPALSCAHIWTLLVYDALEPDPLLSGPAAANQPRFHPVGFVTAVPRAVESGGSDKYVALEFIAQTGAKGVVGSGLAAVPPGADIGVRLCAADDPSPDAHSCKN